MEELTLEQKFAKVLIELRKYSPFYSVIYESIDKIESRGIETIGVTANKMFYNPDFLNTKSYTDLVFIIMHEILHLALMHPVRVGNRDKKLFNIACDLYVNKLIIEEFKPSNILKVDELNISIPNDALYKDTIDTNNDSVESIYEQLESQTGLNGWNDNAYDEYNFKIKGGKGGSSIIKISKDTEDELIEDGSDAVQKENDSKQLVSEIQVKLEMNGIKGVGSSQMNIVREIKEMLKSKLDWKKVLSKYCLKTRCADTSFKTVDTRMLYQEAIYPGLYDDTKDIIKGVKICIDTSGSMSQEDLKYILYHISRITKMYKTEAEIVCWDTIVESTYDITNVIKIIDSGVCGGGGTQAESVFEYFDSKKCKIKPMVSLIFTDGYFNVNKFNPAWKRKYKDTYWIMTRDCAEDFNPPFGKVTKARYD